MNLKSERELIFMRQAGKIVAGALELCKSLVHPGITTGKLNDEIERYILSKGAIPSFKGLYGFPAAACISVNEQVVHGIPGKRRLIEGDIVSVDVGAYISGFHGDAARTFAVGEISKEAQKLIEVTEQCFFSGFEKAKAGNRIGDISAAIEKVAVDAGYGVVRELIGHGVGEKLHEPPDVPNYGTAGRGVRLQKGMTIAIEPMINMGTFKVLRLDDGWTIVSEDGKYSAHFENTIVITDNEPEILTVL